MQKIILSLYGWTKIQSNIGQKPSTKLDKTQLTRALSHKKLQKGSDKRTESNERRRKITLSLSVHARARSPRRRTLSTPSAHSYIQQRQQMTGAVADAMYAWNPAAVIAGAKELIHASNYEKVGEARKSVDDTIAQWVQTVLQQQQQQALYTRGAGLVTEIWRLYAALEIELRQFKQATKVFESAISCPVAGTNKDLWLQYAAFCIERKKFSNARKIFVRGLQAVKEQDQDALWTSFHAFVVAHIEATMSLSTLKAQVLLPESGAATSAASTPTGTSAAAVAAMAVPQSKPAQAAVVSQAGTSVQQIPAPSMQPQQETAQVAADAAQVPANGVTAVEPAKPSPTKTNSSKEPAIAIDPALAFVDKTGKTEPPIPMPVEEDSSSTKKRRMDSQLGADYSKRLKQDGASDQQPQKTQPTLEIADTLYFRHIPTVLPLIPECPHLLFDAAHEGETQMEVGEELLERLSDVLRDSAVFQGVKDLSDNQRQRDRETLYRWQDLVGMQMKEGSELFARHIDVELKHATDPRELITLKAQHLEQRREFITRCQMSQQQFIEITGMDRMNALKAQQISLENMKIPEMTVTTDLKVIGMQRAVLFLILEAEKIWREEMKKIAARSTKDTSAESAGSAGPAHASRGPAYYPHKPQDASSYSNRGGFRGGRGGGYGGKGGGGGGSGGVDRHSNYPRANASYGNRGGPSKRDYDAHPQQPIHSTGAAPHGHHHAPRQQLQVRPSYQGQQQQYHSQQQQQHRSTQNYGGSDRSVTFTQDYSNFPPQQDMNRNGGGGRFVGQSMNGAPVGGGSGSAPPAWQQQPRHNPNQSRGNDYSYQSSRYGSGPSGGGQLALPSQAAVSSYSNGPKQNRGRPYGSAGHNNMAQPQQQQQYGGYGKVSGAPQQQQRGGGGGAPAYQQLAPHNNFQSRDYAAAPQGNSSYSNRNQAPYHQQQQQAPSHQHHQAASFQQRGSRGGRGGYGQQQHHQHQQEQDQPQMNTYHQQGQGYGRGGGGGFRRGGGGGGRYGRR